MPASEAQAEADQRRAALLADYRPLPGVADELLDAEGAVRPVWSGLLDELAALSPEALGRNLDRAGRYLRDAGVFFRRYGADGDSERDWPLSHPPIMIAEAEWRSIEAGLAERAELLEAVMADVYGPNELVRDGMLPAELLTSNPEWLRPMVGVPPRSGRYLHFLAFDIGRGPDGGWWVLGDRTQAPSGAGFALENRMATARSFAGLMGRTHVRRLAGFFRAYRDGLLDIQGDAPGRIAILTPGPMNDTYYEHAYIARYLGFLLVQGQDLTVRDGRLYVRTVAGPSPVPVLWRRLDSAWIDPLELEEASEIGTPGLLGALRAGTVDTVNAVGSGVLETRALMAFLPRIAEARNKRPLSLPNIATWWCGSSEAQAYVQDNLDRMTLDAALSTRLPFDHGPDVVIAGKRADGAAYDPADLEKASGAVAAQEIVALSSAPTLDEGKLVARPMSLRVFLARTADGWTAMPGGFARIGAAGDPEGISMQRGGSVADVWVVSDSAVEGETLLATPATGYRRSQPSSLPSRAADDLFWLGRYSERVEHQVRLARAYHLRVAEFGRNDAALARFLADYMAGIGLDMAASALPDGVLNDIDSAIASAGRIRDRFSTDGWSALTALARRARILQPHLAEGDDAARAMDMLLRDISGFSGLIHENMYRFIGWRFLSLGRAVERAAAMGRTLAALTAQGAPEGSLDVAIEVGDSIMTHRRRFIEAARPETVIDLLLLDALNPRSVLKQLHDIREHLEALPRPDHASAMTQIMRHVMRLETALATATAEDFDPDRLQSVAAAAAELSPLLSASHLR